MYLLKFCFVLLFIVEQVTIGVNAETIEELFKSNDIVPRIIDKAPDSWANVTFPTIVADKGNELNYVQGLKSPKVTWDASDDKLYTIIMYGDLLSVKHWTVGNIPGGNITGGDVRASYLPPTPPPDGKGYLYLILVYQQSSKIDFKDFQILDSSPLSVLFRAGFNPEDYATKYNLGDPIAGNFWYTNFLGL